MAACLAPPPGTSALALPHLQPLYAFVGHGRKRGGVKEHDRVDHLQRARATATHTGGGHTRTVPLGRAWDGRLEPLQAEVAEQAVLYVWFTGMWLARAPACTYM